MNTRKLRSPLAGLAAIAAAAPIAAAQTDFTTLFLVHNVSDSVVAYRIGDDGRPSQVGSLDVSDWPTDIAVSPDGSRLALTHATADSVEVLTVIAVASDGSLSSVATFQIPDSPLAVEWLADDTIAVASSVFGSSSFRVYDYEESPTPTLTLLDTESPGGFLTALECSADRTVLYANDSFGNAVRAYAVSPDRSVTLFDTTFAGLYTIDIKLSPDGTRMYAGCGISGSGRNILGFDVNPDGSTDVDPSPYTSPGQSPAYMCPTGDGAYLIAGHGTDATVRTFAIDPEDGSLTATGYSFDVGLQGTIGDVVETGGFVFITDESTATDGVYGLYSFILNPDGTLTQNGGIIETPGTRPETMVVWNPDASCGADFNGDGDVNTLDVLAFLNAWTSGDQAADFNGDGDVNTLDVLAFLNAWTAGC
ncbi:MAG: GC-type dockerin domain-anchored protein [Phycisphaerales bacterium JB041]